MWETLWPWSGGREQARRHKQTSGRMRLGGATLGPAPRGYSRRIRPIFLPVYIMVFIFKSNANFVRMMSHGLNNILYGSIVFSGDLRSHETKIWG